MPSFLLRVDMIADASPHLAVLQAVLLSWQIAKHAVVYDPSQKATGGVTLTVYG